VSRAALAGTLASLLAVGSTLGCAALPWPQSRVPRAALPAPGAEPPDGWLDLRGSVHVHTEDSHDSPGRLEDVVRAAVDTGLRWVALSEHTRPGGPAKQGVFDGVVVIPGYEIRAWGGSLLLLGARELPADLSDPVKVIRELHAAGGVAFVSHFEESQVTARDWDAARPDGIELLNMHATAVEAGIPRLAAVGLVMPAPLTMRQLLRMPKGNVEHWDALPKADTIVGGSDAHANVRLLGRLGGTVNSYGRMFRLVTTHVLARSHDADAILEALREGRSYVAFEGRARVDRFRFEPIGDAFEIEAPRPARLVLVCDGQEAGRVEAARARLEPPVGARRCRAEAWLGDDPWVVTSYRRL
jgi:hypothetical protein